MASRHHSLTSDTDVQTRDDQFSTERSLDTEFNLYRNGLPVQKQAENNVAVR